jgi:hypothetical protein
MGIFFEHRPELPDAFNNGSDPAYYDSNVFERQLGLWHNDPLL